MRSSARGAENLPQRVGYPIILTAVLQFNRRYRETPATVSRWLKRNDVKSQILLRASGSNVDRFPFAAAFQPIASHVEQTTPVRAVVHLPSCPGSQHPSEVPRFVVLNDVHELSIPDWSQCIRHQKPSPFFRASTPSIHLFSSLVFAYK